MPGPNTTGKPNTNDYNLGRGVIYLSELDSNGLPKAYRDVGNAPQFNVSVDVETLTHQSSREGLKKTDKEVTISQELNLSFQLDELNHENLREFFAGEKGTHTNPAYAGFSKHTMIASANVALGRWYDLVDSSNNRAYDIQQASDLTIETTNGTPATLTEGTDYTLDKKQGRIFLLSGSSVVSTAITNGDGIDVTLASNNSADQNIEEVRALTKTNVKVALKFIGVNPANNDSETEYQFHQVTLKADGDFALISDEFTNMGFTGVAESNETADSDSPTLTIRNSVPDA